MNLTQADKALAAGFAGEEKHLVVTPAVPRYFDVTGIGADGRAHDICIQAADGFEAGNVGIGYGWSAVSARLHEREMTYEQGQARYPRALRLDAFVDAWRGWHDAKAEARAAMPEGVKQSIRDAEQALAIEHDWAFVAQLQHPDPLEQAHRAAQGV